MKKRQLTISVVSSITLAVLFSLMLLAPSSALAKGANQISGTAYWPVTGQCADAAGQGASYSVIMTGDLQGCLYTFAETAKCSAGGAYVETGQEIFVSSLNPADTFGTNYRFEGKYQDCPHALVEIHGRCQHPIVDGSGTGIFKGVKGRLDLKDDLVAGNFPYTGHLQY